MSDSIKKEIQKAVRSYWRTKQEALTKNRDGTRADQGKRGGATAGKNLDGFRDLLCRKIKQTGNGNVEVFENKSGVILPGHFRPGKQWDLVAMCGTRLIAAVELKSLGGPSFGNNANNRCEEALGSGLDFAVAQREGLLGAGATPFIAYFILVEDEEKSRNPPKRGNPSIHFQGDPVFQSASYQHRMRILCERMMQERLYSAASVLATSAKAKRTGDYTDLSPETSFEKMVAKLVGHVNIEHAGSDSQ
jgi:hypothetical protein